MLQLLPVKSLSSKLVVKRSELSLEEFLKAHYLAGSPVIISDCMAHWPAKTKWNNIDYLLRVAGDRTVPVEVITLIIDMFVNCNYKAWYVVTFEEQMQRGEAFKTGCICLVSSIHREKWIAG